MQKPVAVAFVDRADVASSAKQALVTLDAGTLLELARNSVSGGSFTATVPLRPGIAAFPIGKTEPLELLISRNTTSKLLITISPSREGIKLSKVELKFSAPVEVKNPGVFGGGDTANLLGTVRIDKIAFDASGQMSVDGKVRTLVGSFGIPNWLQSMLPKVDFGLETMLKPRRPGSSSSMDKLDPRLLIAALGNIVEKASFNLQIDGLKVAGELSSPSKGALAGKVTGGLDGKLKLSVELAGEGGVLPSGGVRVTHKAGRLVLEAGDMEISRAIAGQLGILVGDRLSVDTDFSATLAHSIAIAISRDGTLGITLTELGAKLALKNASATSPRFNVGLGEPSSVSFNVDQLKADEQGVVIGNGSAALDLTVKQGELGFGSGNVRVKQGTLSAIASGKPEEGGSATLKYDVPTEGDLPGGAKLGGRLQGAIELSVKR